MEENNRKLPNLPSNYVTLVQLQERWMKAQQQKQKQEAKEEQVSEEKLKTAVCVVCPESTEKKIETEGLKKNEKKKKKKERQRKKREPRARAENEVTGGETHAPETSMEEEESLKSRNVVVVVGGLAADRTAEIERKFKDMSIDNGRGGNEKSVRPRHKGRYNHGKNVSNGDGTRRDFGGDNRSFGNYRCEGRNTTNARMVWVKKGENFGVNAGGGAQSSNSLVKSE